MQDRKSRPRLALLGMASFTIAATGCHRVIIDSSLEPSPQVHHEEWNQGFAHAIYPARVDASSYCGGRWARIETKQSFLNVVVEAVTFGIISPMDVKIVCAAPGRRSAPVDETRGGRQDVRSPATENGARR